MKITRRELRKIIEFQLNESSSIFTRMGRAFSSYMSPENVESQLGSAASQLESDLANIGSSLSARAKQLSKFNKCYGEMDQRERDTCYIISSLNFVAKAYSSATVTLAQKRGLGNKETFIQEFRGRLSDMDVKGVKSVALSVSADVDYTFAPFLADPSQIGVIVDHANPIESEDHEYFGRIPIMAQIDIPGLDLDELGYERADAPGAGIAAAAAYADQALDGTILAGYFKGGGSRSFSGKGIGFGGGDSITFYGFVRPGDLGSLMVQLAKIAAEGVKEANNYAIDEAMEVIGRDKVDQGAMRHRGRKTGQYARKSARRRFKR